jgi:hypothetical protein
MQFTFHDIIYHLMDPSYPNQLIIIPSPRLSRSPLLLLPFAILLSSPLHSTLMLDDCKPEYQLLDVISNTDYKILVRQSDSITARTGPNIVKPDEAINHSS